MARGLNAPGSVWVLTERFDSTADTVIDELNRRGVSVFRFDVDDITVTARLEGTRWVGTLATATRTVSIEDAAGIFYRRPTPSAAPPGLDPDVDRWITAERRWGLRGLLAALPRDRWINWPPAIHTAEHKPTNSPSPPAAASRSPLPRSPTTPRVPPTPLPPTPR